MKKLFTKLKALMFKTEGKPIELNGKSLLAWWDTILPETVIVDSFTDHKGKGCVVGQYQRCISKNINDYSSENTSDNHSTQSNTLRGWSINMYAKIHANEYGNIVNINNGTDPLYPQTTPWLRVKSFLKDVQAYEISAASVVKEHKA